MVGKRAANGFRALLVLSTVSCGGRTVGSQGGGGSIPLCEGWDECVQQLTDRTYDLPCYPHPGPVFTIGHPDEPMCGAAVENFVVCMANEPDALLCPPNGTHAYNCEVCVAERAAADATCEWTTPCAEP